MNWTKQGGYGSTFRGSRWTTPEEDKILEEALRNTVSIQLGEFTEAFRALLEAIVEALGIDKLLDKLCGLKKKQNN